MDRESADLALQFLARTDLKGHETPQFSRVVEALMAERDAPEPEDDESTAPGGTD